jgi:hypothetical protein
MVKNQGVILHKASLIKGHIYDHDIYKNNFPITTKQIVKCLT